MQKIIYLTCFVLEITRRGGNPPPNHLTSIKNSNQNRVKKFCEKAKHSNGSYTVLMLLDGCNNMASK